MTCNKVNKWCKKKWTIKNNSGCIIISCPDGQYGYNCQEKCNVNCGVPYKFDKITSLCTEGCQVGWKGITCNESKNA